MLTVHNVCPDDVEYGSAPIGQQKLVYLLYVDMKPVYALTYLV